MTLYELTATTSMYESVISVVIPILVVTDSIPDEVTMTRNLFFAPVTVVVMKGRLHFSCQASTAQCGMNEQRND